MNVENRISAKNVELPNVNVVCFAYDLKKIINQIALLTGHLKNKLETAEAENTVNEILADVNNFCRQGEAIIDSFIEPLTPGGDHKIKLDINTLNHIINERGWVYSKLVKEKNSRVKVILPDKKFFYVVNKAAFLRAMDKLFSIALRYLTEKERMEIKLYERSGNACVEIHNTCSGTQEHLYRDLFGKTSENMPKYEKFERNNRSGLQTVKKMVESQDGKLFFSSNESGFSFFIEFKNGLIL